MLRTNPLSLDIIGATEILNDAARRDECGVLRISSNLSACVTGSAGCNTNAVRAAIEATWKLRGQIDLLITPDPVFSKLQEISPQRSENW